MLDTLCIALSNLESDLAVMLARHLDGLREVKKLLATPGTVRVPPAAWPESATRGDRLRAAPSEPSCAT